MKNHQRAGLVAAASLLVLASNAGALQEGQERDFDAELAALVERYEEAQKEWRDDLRAASTGEERQALFQNQPGPRFVPEFRSLADDAVGTEAAGGAWMWVLRLATEEHRELCLQAIEILVQDFADSKAITELPLALRYGGDRYGDEVCLRGLRTLVSTSAEPEVRAPAMHNLAAYMIDRSGATDADREEATAILKKLAAEHGELKDSRGRKYADLAKGLIQAMNIAPGKPAPEIEGEDLDGVTFKLSDYRGKVVLLDFWGHW